jgi:hypothetical protein
VVRFFIGSGGKFFHRQWWVWASWSGFHWGRERAGGNVPGARLGEDGGAGLAGAGAAGPFPHLPRRLLWRGALRPPGPALHLGSPPAPNPLSSLN